MMMMNGRKANVQEKRVKLLQAQSETSQPPSYTSQAGLQDTSRKRVQGLFDRDCVPRTTNERAPASEHTTMQQKAALSSGVPYLL
jgi:hypothetical protein